MYPAVQLKEKLTRSEPVLGILVIDHLWLELVEVAINAGLDYLIVDTEHQSRNGEFVAEVCRLGRMANFPILLRPQRTDTESISLAMDLGPCGLLLPMIESAEQLDGVRDGIYMPPRGKRRPGGASNRWVTEFDYETFKAQVEDHVVILPQIEGLRGLENAAAIAEHEITTALAAGPFDLSAQLGVCGDSSHAKLQAALAQIREAARQAGKPAWMIGNAEELARQGYHFICMGEPTAMLEIALKNKVSQVREAEIQ
ncbi:MAG: hypothetical protein GXP26_04740 [Planctomycetes bacterium]|nr:hypothetical protein [Planctomycetota bacterium]